MCHDPQDLPQGQSIPLQKTAVMPPRPHDTETEINKLQIEWYRDFVNRDYDRIAQQLATAFTFTSFLGQVMDRETFLDAHRAGERRVMSAAATEQKIQIYDDCVVSSATVLVKGVFSGMEFSGPMRSTWVWTRQSGAWKTVALHLSDARQIVRWNELSKRFR